MTEFIRILYFLMFAYALYKTSKIMIFKFKKRENEKFIPQRLQAPIYILSGLMFAMFFMVDDVILKGILIFLTLFFLYTSLESISISDLGIYHNGTLIGWDRIKKWTFDEKRGELVVLQRNSKAVNIFPIRSEFREELHKIIKNHRK